MEHSQEDDAPAGHAVRNPLPISSQIEAEFPQIAATEMRRVGKWQVDTPFLQEVDVEGGRTELAVRQAEEPCLNLRFKFDGPSSIISAMR